jgi:hypothetical protein
MTERPVGRDFWNLEDIFYMLVLLFKFLMILYCLQGLCIIKQDNVLIIIEITWNYVTVVH